MWILAPLTLLALIAASRIRREKVTKAVDKALDLGLDDP